MKNFAFRNVRIITLGLASLVLTSSQAIAADDNSSSLPAPPVAKKVPKTTEINGHTLVDNYFKEGFFIWYFLC